MVQRACLALAACALACLLPRDAHALTLKGTIRGTESWKFLGRFCFLPSNSQSSGKVQGKLTASFRFKQDSRLSLLEYLERGSDYAGDESVTSFSSWANVYSGDADCSTRMKQGLMFPLWDPSLASACKNIYMHGRVGSNTIMNGLWSEYEDPVTKSSTFGGRRIYARAHGDGWLFIFYKADSGQYFMARELGGKLVVAQADTQAISPDQMKPGEFWEVADGQDGFQVDEAVGSVCADDLPEGEDLSSLLVPPPPGTPPPPAFTLPPGDDDATPVMGDLSITSDQERIYTGLQADSEGYVLTNREQLFSDEEARWMFIAVANCLAECDPGALCQGSLDLEYEIQLTNGDGWSVKHFSADEIGILETELFFFCCQVLLAVFAVYVRHCLVILNKFHYTVMMLCGSIGLTLVAMFFDVVHYGRFAADGVGAPTLHTLSMWLTGVAETVFLMMIILLAKGWSICCRKLSATGRVKIAVYSTVYIMLWTILLVWFDFGVSKAEVVYLYHCTPGYLVCIMRVVAVCWLCYSTYVTLTKFNTKRRFFQKFAFLFSIWLLSLPVMVLIALGIPLWVRAKVVAILELLFTFVAQLTMLLLYFPASYNASFPFHATMEDMTGKATRMVITNNRETISRDGEGNVTEEQARSVALGNTTRVQGFGRGGKLERAALRSALELASRMSSDMMSLKGALDALEATHDDVDDDLDEDRGFNGHHHQQSHQPGGGGGSSMMSVFGRGPASNRAMHYSAGTSNPGFGQSLGQAPSLRASMAAGNSLGPHKQVSMGGTSGLGVQAGDQGTRQGAGFEGFSPYNT